MGGGEMADEPPQKATNDEYRLLLQLETSLLVWLRTSLALMGFGFVIARFGFFLRELAQVGHAGALPHTWVTAVNASTGTALVVLGVAVLLVAAWNYRRAVDQLRAGEPVFPSRWPLAAVVLSVLLAAMGMGLAVYLSVVGS
jgi:putative membrane protein